MLYSTVWPKIQYNCQNKIFDSRSFRKEVLKNPRMFNLENVICILKNPVKVAMRMEAAFYNISTYFFVK